MNNYLREGLNAFLLVGAVVGGAHLNDMLIDAKTKEKKELIFKSIPEVYQLDSIYTSRRDSLDNAYYLQRDSLREIHSQYIDDVVRGK